MNFNKAEFEMAAGTAKQLPKSEKPEIVFSGRSNVGKSSLINKLVNRKALARVSATPGKTATINFFDAGDFRLVDLPGYGYAKVSQSEKKRWAELVEGYFAQDRQFCLIVQIVDLRHPPTKDDMQMIDFLYSSGFPFIIVLTKKDKLNKTEFNKRMESINTELSSYSDVLLFPFSALKGDGKEEIQNYISKCVEDFMNGE
ncbi:MAG: ribosome biogenesis GTP-binding protein YihA/YsxC [Acutalibacteraceae bacterium]